MYHIAIFRQPFFDMILSGEKTIESRWSFHKIAPYKRVKVGDVILLKETGKDVTAKAIVADVKYYELTPEIADLIKIKYGDKIGIEKFENWEECRQKNYLTLIWLVDVERINPMKVRKSNGSGWLVLKDWCEKE